MLFIFVLTLFLISLLVLISVSFNTLIYFIYFDYRWSSMPLKVVAYAVISGRSCR